MRQHRRTSFAAPFVMVVATACGGSKPPIHDNPPDPKREALTAEQCKQLQQGERCETNEERCAIADGCGLNGFECKNGVWEEQMTLCNPPPPEPTAPPPPK